MPSATICLKVSAEVVFEDGVFVAESPELDIASQGCTKEEALRNLKEALYLFLETCFEMGTLDQVLHQSGFSKTSMPTVVADNRNDIDICLPYIAAAKTRIFGCHA
jgi:predicted RNase H-like HicB family nuclease